MDITNAAQPADPVPIPVPAVQNLLPVIPVTQRQQSLLRNAEALVIPVRPMPAADTALPAARVTVPAVPACPARQLSTSLTLVTPGTQCRVPVASRMILVIIILQKHAPTDVRSITVIVLQNVKRASLVQILVQVDLNLIPIILEQHVTVGTGLMYRLAQPNAEVFVWNVILALTVPAREWPVTVLMTIVHKQERAVFVQNVQLVAVTLLTVGVIIPIPAVLIVQKSIKPLTSKVHAVRAIIVATKQ